MGDLITADRKVLSEGCESRNNHRYAVVVQDLATSMDPGTSVQKQNFTRNPREACKSSWNPRGNQKSFTLTIPWNLASLLKNYTGIINGPIIPYSSMVEYHPISAKDQSRLHKFGAKVLPGFFPRLCIVRGGGGGGIWKGDIMVADIDELEQMDASELHARRLNAKEVLTTQRIGNFICPVAHGTVKIFG